MPDPEHREEEPGTEGGSFIEEHVVPLIVEPTLGPVWLVLIAHVAAFGAWALLIALEQGRIWAYLGVFGLFWLTGTAAVTEIRQRGRAGALSGLIAATWALTLGFAWGAQHFGLF